jgi:hypothetical protein
MFDEKVLIFCGVDPSEGKLYTIDSTFQVIQVTEL